MAHLIDKDALVAEIERRIKELEPFRTKDNFRAHGAISGYYQILSFINTLEVKEVNLDEEIEKFLKQYNMLAVGKKDFTDIAKHFFELALSLKNS